MKTKATKRLTKIQKKVLIRTYSAGVHLGKLVSRKGTEVVLTDARRIWRWRGANTLNEIAMKGIEPATKGWSRVSEPVKEIVLTGVIEIITVTELGWKSIVTAGWAP